ncbi:hypothetical protein T03_4460 [Trichinella britovi]|uniref:Uncharacterized protein n=1 Tax=Trichinella britovi TaxID=45882 RepID=A0A0V1AJQ3_TRIBR|nr:hypothetical protein T03_4460 [Trichinella britovi]
MNYFLNCQYQNSSVERAKNYLRNVTLVSKHLMISYNYGIRTSY